MRELKKSRRHLGPELGDATLVQNTGTPPRLIRDKPVHLDMDTPYPFISRCYTPTVVNTLNIAIVLTLDMIKQEKSA